MANGPDGARPLGEVNYTQFADRYAAAIDAKPHNAYYERPATLSLLPPLAGLDVLDVGCGPGAYADVLNAAGARVTALDVTPRMLEIAAARLNGRGVRFLRADFARPLPFTDAAFDLVIAPLVLGYIADWRQPFREVARVLRPSGSFVFSDCHPMFAWELVGGECYFAATLFEERWSGFGEPKPLVRGWRRSLQDMLNPVVEAGLVLDRILEPLPTSDFAKADPQHFAELSRAPAFICVRSRSPG